MTIDAQIAAIKSRIESGRLAAARAEVGKETADKEYSEAMAALRDQFGVDSPEQVRAKLAELQSNRAKKLAEVEEILDTHKL